TVSHSRSTRARAALYGTTPPKRSCSSVCDRTTLERILPLPSPERSTTAAAVSSQVVSIPSTSIGVSLTNCEPLHDLKKRRLAASVALRGRARQSPGGG